MNDFTLAAKVRKLVEHSLFSDVEINKLVKPSTEPLGEGADATVVSAEEKVAKKAAEEKSMVDKVYERAEELEKEEGNPNFGHDPARAHILLQSIKTLRLLDLAAEHHTRTERFEAQINATDRLDRSTFDETA